MNKTDLGPTFEREFGEAGPTEFGTGSRPPGPVSGSGPARGGWHGVLADPPDHALHQPTLSDQAETLGGDQQYQPHVQERKGDDGKGLGRHHVEKRSPPVPQGRKHPMLVKAVRANPVQKLIASPRARPPAVSREGQADEALCALYRAMTTREVEDGGDRT